MLVREGAHMFDAKDNDIARRFLRSSASSIASPSYSPECSVSACRENIRQVLSSHGGWGNSWMLSEIVANMHDADLHERVNDVVLAAIEVIQHVLLEHASQQSAGHLPRPLRFHLLFEALQRSIQ